MSNPTMFPTAPTLITSRLTLRAHTRADFEALWTMWSAPEVVAHTTRKPASEQDAWFRLMRYLGHWPMLGYGYWAMCETETGLYLGDVGFADFKRNIAPHFDGSPEAGWVLAPAAFGKGYATEAMTAVLGWHEAHWGPGRTVCMIDPDNAASINVARKLGYLPYDRANYGTPVVLFERG
jgi:RimJ/RimL family protein N-acetyltransferase